MLARSIYCKESVGFENSAELSQFVQIEHQNASARDITDSHYTKNRTTHY